MVCASSKFSIYDKTNFIMFVIGNGSVMAFVGKCWWLHNGNVDRYQNITSIGTLENERIVKRSWRKKACGSRIFSTPPFVDCFSIRWKRWYDTLPMATTAFVSVVFVSLSITQFWNCHYLRYYFTSTITIAFSMQDAPMLCNLLSLVAQVFSDKMLFSQSHQWL